MGKRTGQLLITGFLIAVTVWGGEEDEELLLQIIDGFLAKYQGQANFAITYEPQSESSCTDALTIQNPIPWKPFCHAGQLSQAFDPETGYRFLKNIFYYNRENSQHRSDCRIKS